MRARNGWFALAYGTAATALQGVRPCGSDTICETCVLACVIMGHATRAGDHEAHGSVPSLMQRLLGCCRPGVHVATRGCE